MTDREATTMDDQRITHSQVEADLARAVQAGGFDATLEALVARAGDLEPAAAELVARTDELARGFAAQTATEGERLADALRAAGIGVERLEVPVRKLHVFAELHVDGAAVESRRVLEANGYSLQLPLSAGAWESYRRTHRRATFLRNDDPTQRAEVTWASSVGGNPVARALTPNAPDFVRIALPGWAWPAYWAVRAGRLLWEKGLHKPRGFGDLGPFLPSHRGVALAALELATPTPQDVLVDLGCGDGRVLVEAAETFGVTARGSEHDARLVAQARERSARSTRADRITVADGDALADDLSDATIVYANLPAEVLAEHLTGLLRRLPLGGRLVATSQQPVTWPSAPDASRFVAADGLAVAHRWNATPRP